MLRRSTRFVCIAAVIAAAVAQPFERHSGAAAATLAGPKAYYLALGDSVTFGAQPNGDYSHGFADDLFQYLQARGTTTLVNMACRHETTTTFMHGGCPDLSSVKYSYGSSSSQLAAAPRRSDGDTLHPHHRPARRPHAEKARVPCTSYRPAVAGRVAIAQGCKWGHQDCSGAHGGPLLSRSRDHGPGDESNDEGERQQARADRTGHHTVSDPLSGNIQRDRPAHGPRDRRLSSQEENGGPAVRFRVPWVRGRLLGGYAHGDAGPRIVARRHERPPRQRHIDNCDMKAWKPAVTHPCS